MFNFLKKNNVVYGAEGANAGAEDSSEDTNEVDNLNNSIYFYTPVTTKSCLNLNKKIKSLGVELLNIRNSLGANYTPNIQLHINSPGGSLLDCFSTIGYVKKSVVPIDSIVEGTAASAATLISVVAQRRFITEDSYMLIHQLSSGCWGKFEDLKDDMKNNEVFMEAIYNIYEKHTKIPKNTLKEILKRDIYFSAKECLKYKLVDAII